MKPPLWLVLLLGGWGSEWARAKCLPYLNLKGSALTTPSVTGSNGSLHQESYVRTAALGSRFTSFDLAVLEVKWGTGGSLAVLSLMDSSGMTTVSVAHGSGWWVRRGLCYGWYSGRC
jgi:hypothetical protein